MNALLNVLWWIFGGGLIMALEYAIGGLLLCLTVVGIPFGLQAFKLAGLSLWPFGQEVWSDIDTVPGPVGMLGNILWFVFAGLWIFISHIGLGLGLAVTIIGIPFAIQHFKLARLALMPFGTRFSPVRI